MKKTFTVFAAIVAIFAVYSGGVFWMAKENVVAAEPKVRLYLTPASPSIFTGESTSLQIRLSKNTNSKVDYANADLTFATAYLEVTSLSKQGSYFSANGGPAVSYSNPKGTISVKGTGAELPTVADVLVATVTFKGKAAGTASASFTAASKAGDITNGGHVKDALDTKTGATFAISAPSPIEEPGIEEPGTEEPGIEEPGTEEPGTEGDVVEEEPVVETPTEDSDPDEDSPLSQSSQGGDGDGSTPAASEPFWKKFLWPIIGVSVLLGIGAVGGTLALRKRGHAGVGTKPSAFMPPTVLEDPAAEEEAMQALNPAAVEATPQDELPVEQEVDVPTTVATTDIPEEPVAEVETPEVVGTPPVETAPPIQQPQTQQIAPEPVTPSLAVQSPVVPQEVAAEAPAQTPASQPQAQSVTPQPATRNTTDYTNLPDMFDVGEQRLRDEGLVDMKPTVSK